jgi:hypothetical protein
MFTLGMICICVGLAGIAEKAWRTYMDINDPRFGYKARVAKTRLDTKKADGQETYTYIVTFFIYEENRYESFKVSQKEFDVIMEKDNGVLYCNLKRKNFLAWKITAN